MDESTRRISYGDYKELKGGDKIESLTSEERETIISWNDEDKDMIYIYTSQQPMIRKLLKNPLFKLKSKTVDKNYRCYPAPISIDGYIPKRALTIRTKIVKRNLTPEQRAELAERLSKSRSSK